MQLTDKKIISVSKLIVKTFQRLGIDKIFGYPGSSVLSLYDELYQQDRINHYLLRHEQSAVHAAEAYSRVSGKCGVVLVTAGPGATNTITGIANAYLDGYPLIIISGQVATSAKGKGAFQEINFIEMVKHCAKAVLKIETAEDIEHSILQAYLLATSGKKGPVVIEIPKDILDSHTEYRNLSLPEDNKITYDNIDTQKVFELIKSSKAPLIISGGGVVHAKAFKELFTFSTMLNIPIVSTMMGIGAFPQNNSLYSGMIGTYGDIAANKKLISADLLIILGSRLNDRILNAFEFDKFNHKTIILVDINSEEISQNINVDYNCSCDIKYFLNEMTAFIKNTKYSVPLSSFEVEKNTQNAPLLSESLTMKKIIKELSEYIKDLSIKITTDVGQHQIALINNFQFNLPETLITSGGFGTMGFGLPAAIGASIASNKSPIILFSGDGSFQMSLSELAVCKEYNLPIKIMIMNNGYLGMVRQLQQEQCNERYYATAISNPDFVQLAKSYGIDGIKVDNSCDLKSVFDIALKNDRPYLMDFIIDPRENV